MRLSEAHQNMLFEESGNSPDVVAERGVRTIAHGRELPAGFSPRQRRLGPGILFTAHRPNGKTSYSFRPDTPDKPGRKYEQPSKRHGGPGNVLDIHPSLHHLIADMSVPVIYVEGIKKADSITTAARAAGVEVLVVAISGVWNFLCEGKPIPDLLVIPVEGREVGIVFDSDVLTNPGVQGAAVRLAETEIGRGASVRLAYLPDAADGSKVGADDFLVSGKTYAELRVTMRAYDPGDFEVLRLTRDEKLRALVGDLRARWWAEEWKGRGGHSERDIALQLIEAATRSGKAHPDGIRVAVSWGMLQVGAKVARQTLAKALARLEERGFCYRDNEGRKAEKAGAFVLRAKVDQYGERVRQETRELRGCDPGGLPLRAPDVPRLRWSRPKWKPTKKMIMEYRLRELSSLPEPRERIERLGKIRGAIVDALEASGGLLALPELCEVLHHSRPRDVRRRVLPMLKEAGVIECEGDVVSLAANWREKLDAARKVGGELEADELAEVNRKLKSRAYRDRDKTPVSKPSAAGLEAVKRSHAMRDARLEEIARAEEERRRAGPPPELEALISDLLGKNGKLRMGLLCELATEEGFEWRDVPEATRAMGYRVERLEEYGDEEFVFPSIEGAA
jgi:hypothetical protein